MYGPPRLHIQTLQDVTLVTINDPHIRDMNQVQQIATELYDLVDHQRRTNLILDFSKVVLLSSSALGALITLNKKTQALQGRLILAGVRDDIHRLFELAKMHRLFTFHPTVDQALGEFGITPA